MFFKQSSSCPIESCVWNRVNKFIDTFFYWSGWKRFLKFISFFFLFLSIFCNRLFSFFIFNFFTFLFFLLSTFFSRNFLFSFLRFTLGFPLGLVFLGEFLGRFLRSRSLLNFWDNGLTLTVNFEHLCFHFNTLSNLVNGLIDHINEGFQGVLVEWVDLGQVREQEINQSTSDSSRTIQLRCLINFSLCDLGDLHLFTDFNWNSLWVFKVFNKGNIVKDISLSIGKFEKQLSFKLVQFDLEVILLSDKF